MDLNLAGKTAVVTGGARGIGLAVARALAAEGMNVALLDLLDGVTEAAQQITADFGVRTLGRRLDVTDQDATNAAFDAVHAELGVPQVLLTAAGIEINGDSIDVTADQWRKVIDVNLTGTFFASQAFGRGLLHAGLPGSAILSSRRCRGSSSTCRSGPRLTTRRRRRSLTSPSRSPSSGRPRASA